MNVSFLMSILKNLIVMPHVGEMFLHVKCQNASGFPATKFDFPIAQLVTSLDCKSSETSRQQLEYVISVCCDCTIVRSYPVSKRGLLIICPILNVSLRSLNSSRFSILAAVRLSDANRTPNPAFEFTSSLPLKFNLQVFVTSCFLIGSLYS